MHISGKIFFITTTALISASLSACSGFILSDPVTAYGFKLNTFVEIDSYDNVRQDVLNEALSICDDYENITSMYKNGSELWNINHNMTTDVSAELGDILNQALVYSLSSDGSFQITIGSVSSLWDFTAKSPNAPDPEAVKAALPYVDDTKISVLKKETPDEAYPFTIIKPEKAVIDLGSVSKGYIADKIKEFLISNGVSHAIINLGGNVLCIGDLSDKPFTIAIKDPTDTAKTALSLNITDKSVVTSGISERFFTDEAGNYYHHILNPSTGYPYDNDLAQVTIISDSSFQGDALSTLSFTKGCEKGLELIESINGVEAIFIKKDGTQHFSSGAGAYVK